DALAATEMPTFYGNIKFDSTGKNTAKPMVLRQIQDGKYVVVAPAKYAKDKPELPRKAGS
nr:amino acid ABC transporter substrate-binding protein [Betaproteobacteria bacterium]